MKHYFHRFWGLAVDICGGHLSASQNPPGDSGTLSPDDKLVSVTVGAADMCGGEKMGDHQLHILKFCIISSYFKESGNSSIHFRELQRSISLDF